MKGRRQKKERKTFLNNLFILSRDKQTLFDFYNRWRHETISPNILSAEMRLNGERLPLIIPYHNFRLPFFFSFYTGSENILHVIGGDSFLLLVDHYLFFI